MKTTFLKPRMIGLMLLLAFVIPSVLFTGCKKKPVTEQKDPVKKEMNTEVLLSFDSYEEITRAGLKIGGHFGETKINTEKDYITEGKGSWLIRPQGDYGKEGNYPTIRLRCTESTFVKSDFNSYDKLFMDVYNDSKEEVKIEFSLSANNAFNSYDSGEIVAWTLKPNAWTKCEYDLSGEEYSAALDLTEARYMNITILSKKESKDDTMPTLYFDNLRGHISGEERESKEFDENFQEMVTFENVLERYLFNAGTVGNNKVSLSRVAYENSVIGAQEEAFGTYGLQGSVQGATWPATTMRYNEELPAGTIMSCKVYVAADETEFGDATYYLEPSGCSVFNGRLKFNRWETVEFELQKAVESTWFFLNFDNGTGSSMFGSTPVTYFMDNFQIIKKPEVDFTKGVDLEDPTQRFLFNSVSLAEYETSSIRKQSSAFGKYGLTRDLTKYTWPSFAVNFGTTYKKGDRMSFMVYVEADETKTSEPYYYMGSWDVDVMNSKLEFNKWNQIEVVFKKDTAKANIFVNLDDGNEKNKLGDSKVTAYFDNFVVVEQTTVRKNNDFRKGVNFEDEKTLSQYLFTYSERVKYADTTLGAQSATYGEYGIKRDGTGITWPSFYIDLCKEYPAGDVLTFMLYVEVDKTLAAGKDYHVGAYGHDVNSDTKEYNQWVEVQVPLKTATDSVGLFLNFDDGNEKNMFGKATVTAYMDNFKVIDVAQVKKMNDVSDTITFEDREKLQDYLFTSTELITYANTSLGKQDETYGTYGIMRNATGMTWPSFYMDLCKKYSTDSILTFMLYVEVDETLAAGKNYFVSAYGHDVTNDRKEFNKWVKVEVPLKTATDRIGMFLNFDNGNEKNMFGQAKLTAYMDNFRIIDTSGLSEKSDFAEGVTFEDRDAMAEYLFTSVELVNYEETTLGKQSEKYGTYGIMRNGTKITWPSFYADLCKEYSKDSVLTFMLYVEVDETLAEGKNYFISAYGHDVSNDRKEFNKWVQVDVPLKTAVDSIGMFLNFDDGNEKNMFGEAKVTAYMDNFKILDTSDMGEKNDFAEGITFEDREAAAEYLFTYTGLVDYAESTIGTQSEKFGKYGIVRNGTGIVWPAFTIDFCEEYEVGDILSFMLYVDVDETLAAGKNYFVSAFGHDVSNDKKEFNKWVQVDVPLKTAVDSIGLFLNFDDGNEKNMFGTAPILAYMDNFRIVKTDDIANSTDFESGVTFEGSQMAAQYLFANTGFVNYADTALGAQSETYGESGLTFDATKKKWPGFTVLDLGKEYPANSRLCFSIYAQADETLTEGLNFWVDNDDATKHPFNQWTEGFVKLSGNSRYIFLNFEAALNTLGESDITVYLDNFYISECDYEKGITFESPADKYAFGQRNVAYTLQEFDGTTTLTYDATGKYWPEVSALFKQNYTGNSTRLCFKIYVEADPALVENQIFWVGNDDGTRHKFNQWTEGFVKIGDNTNSKTIFLNFESAIKAIGATTPITVHLDDFYLTTGSLETGITLENPADKYVFWRGNEDYTFEEFDGSTAMKFAANQNWPQFGMQIDKAPTVSKTLYFKIYAEVDESLVTDEVFYVGNNDPRKHPFNQWTEGYVTVPAGSTSSSIFLNFEAALKTIGKNNITVYLDDFVIK